MISRKLNKHTDSIAFSDEWHSTKIGDFCTCYSGGTPNTSIREYYGGAIPWITSSDLNSGTIIEVEGKITEAGLSNSSAKVVKEGTLLLALYGATAGTCAITKIQSAINQAVLAIIPTNVDNNYLFQYLRFKKEEFIKTFTQGGQPNLSGELVKTFVIPLPPTLAEQEAIAAALSDADAWIESLEQLIAKKRQVKQGMMQELLTGKRRLPGFTGEWEEKKVGEVLKLIYGKGQNGIRESDGAYPIMATSGEVGRTNAYLYNKPSIIIGRKGSIDNPQFIDTPFWAIDTTYFCEISVLADGKYLFYLLNTIDWKSYNEASGVPSLNAKTVENIKLNLPSLSEQIAIAKIITGMDMEIGALGKKLTKARQIKQGMMQELLSGRIRLV